MFYSNINIIYNNKPEYSDLYHYNHSYYGEVEFPVIYSSSTNELD